MTAVAVSWLPPADWRGSEDYVFAVELVGYYSQEADQSSELDNPYGKANKTKLVKKEFSESDTDGFIRTRQQ